MKSKYWILLCALLIFSITSVRSLAQTVANYSFSGYCSGYPTQFSDLSTSNYTILSYNWDFNNDSVFNDATGPATQHSFLAGNYRVGLKVISTNDSSIVYTNFIIQSVAPAFSINVDSQCLKNNNFVFTNSSILSPSGTISYLWDFGDGVTDTSKNTNHSYTLQNKTYSVKLIATSDQGCKDSISKNATIHPQPQVSFTTPDTLNCKNEVFNFNNTSTITPLGTLLYLWDFGDGNQINSVNTMHSYSSFGIYTVSLKGTSVKGCYDTFKLNVHVDTTLYVSFTVNKDSQCFNGNSFVFTNTSGYCGTIDSTVWDLNGDGIFTDANGNTVNHVYTTYGNFNVGMIVYNGVQKDTAYHMVSVLPSPIANFSITNPTQTLGSIFMFNNSSSITPTSSLIYNWHFGDGSTSINFNPSYTYPITGVFSVKLIVTSNKGCKDSISKTATVLAPLAIDFTADTICGKDSTSFVNKSSSVNPILQVNWDFNNDTIFTDASGNNVKHLFSNPGTYKVGLQIITNVDTGTIFKLVVVYPKPVAGFSINTVNQNLTGNNFILTNTTTITPTRSINYLWDFNDASTSSQTNVSHSYIAIGSYNIKLTATSSDGCIDTISHRVNVLANISLIANFTADSVCFQQFSTLTNTSTSYYPLLQINWDLDNNGLFDNGTGQILSYNFPAGIFTIGLQVITAYDTSVLYKDIIVYPSPKSNFMINRAIQPLQGNNFVFTNTSLISPYSELTFDWAYGDGNTSISIDGIHSYTALGSYNVRLIAISDKGCRDTVTKQVQLVSFTLNIDFSNNKTCIGDTTFFTNLTAITNDSIINYIWDFGDGSPTTMKVNPKHFYAAAGNYDVLLIVLRVSGNKDTLTKTVPINPKPVITIISTPDTIIYIGQTVTLSIAGTYDSILWSTGSTKSSVDVTSAGTYSVRVVDDKGCSSSESTNIFILPKKAMDVVTGFTPNGDGINDYWKIINIDAFGKCKVTIFNRWGDQIYFSSDYKNDWDGKRKGKMLPQGTYYYMIETPNDGTYTGPVNIVK